MIINVRGTNGSGKTTAVLHALGREHAEVILHQWEEPTRAHAKGNPKPRVKQVVGCYSVKRNVTAVGHYRTATGGMDTIPNFEAAREAILQAARNGGTVLCEGILASTVWGSWAQFAAGINKDLTGEALGPFVFAYILRPVDDCLRLIRERQEASGKVRPIKEHLVRDKDKAIRATRRKARAAGFTVYDLSLEHTGASLVDIIQGRGERFLAR